MKEILNKLQHVKDVCLNKNIQTRIALLLIKLSDSTPPTDVSGKELDDVTETATPLSVLEDNADEFLVLMRTLPDNHELKKSIRTLDLIVNKVKSSLSDVSIQLKDIISSDKEDLPKGDLMDLAELLETANNEFSTTIELVGKMESMAQQSKEEQKHKPVEHKLEKIKLGPKKKEDNKIDIGEPEEDKNKKVNKTLKKLDELIKSK